MQGLAGGSGERSALSPQHRRSFFFKIKSPDCMCALAFAVVAQLLLVVFAVDESDYFDGPVDEYDEQPQVTRPGGSGVFKDLPKIMLIVGGVFACVIAFTIYVIYLSEKHSANSNRKKKRAYKYKSMMR
jgi:hypothetical protein